MSEGQMKKNMVRDCVSEEFTALIDAAKKSLAAVSEIRDRLFGPKPADIKEGKEKTATTTPAPLGLVYITEAGLSGLSAIQAETAKILIEITEIL